MTRCCSTIDTPNTDEILLGVILSQLECQDRWVDRISETYGVPGTSTSVAARSTKVTKVTKPNHTHCSLRSCAQRHER